MRHGSLFSGIGGFDLAAEWMGWENIFHCEINPFCQKVLKHYWPNSTQYHDITKTDFTIHRGQIDILTGGFPCQPYSAAGKRLGKEDSRHLWPEMLRAIREVAPKYIVGENVFGLLNWNGGVVFNEVHSDLESEGYEVQAVVIPAAAVNAPHGRDRVFFVATDPDIEQREWKKGGFQSEFINDSQTATDPEFNTEGSDHGTNDETRRDVRRRNKGDVFGTLCSNGDATDTDRIGYRWWNKQSKSNQAKERKICKNEQQHRDGIWCEVEGCGWTATNPELRGKCSIRNWNIFPTQSPICCGDDGISSELDGITFSKWRNESIKGYGNAVVPQVVYQIFKAIEQTRIKQHEKKD